MDDSFIVHGYLRLYALIWNADDSHTLALVHSGIKATAHDSKSKYFENGESPFFHLVNLRVFNQSLH